MRVSRSPAVSCGVPESPGNGSFAGNEFTLESQVTYACDEGFRLDAGHQATAVCQEDGSWSQPPPTCRRECALHAPRPAGRGRGGLAGERPDPALQRPDRGGRGPPPWPVGVASPLRLEGVASLLRLEGVVPLHDRWAWPPLCGRRAWPQAPWPQAPCPQNWFPPRDGMQPIGVSRPRERVLALSAVTVPGPRGVCSDPRPCARPHWERRGRTTPGAGTRRGAPA